MLESKFPNYYNKTICLIETLKSSNNSTEEVKGNLTGLFVIAVKPCCTVFKDILSRLLKKDLKKSMYLHEEHFFSPYSNRAWWTLNFAPGIKNKFKNFGGEI